MADDRIRSLQAPNHRPTHKGLCVDTENDFIYTNPEEKVDDFRREAGKVKLACLDKHGDLHAGAAKTCKAGLSWRPTTFHWVTWSPI